MAQLSSPFSFFLESSFLTWVDGAVVVAARVKPPVGAVVVAARVKPPAGAVDVGGAVVPAGLDYCPVDLQGPAVDPSFFSSVAPPVAAVVSPRPNLGGPEAGSFFSSSFLGGGPVTCPEPIWPRLRTKPSSASSFLVTCLVKVGGLFGASSFFSSGAALPKAFRPKASGLSSGRGGRSSLEARTGCLTVPRPHPGSSVSPSTGLPSSRFFFSYSMVAFLRFSSASLTFLRFSIFLSSLLASSTILAYSSRPFLVMKSYMRCS
jgi:hypothetical protein